MSDVADWLVEMTPDSPSEHCRTREISLSKEDFGNNLKWLEGNNIIFLLVFIILFNCCSHGIGPHHIISPLFMQKVLYRTLFCNFFPYFISMLRQGHGFRGGSEQFHSSGCSQSTCDPIIYQVCGKSNHTAKKCFQRFDITYIANSNQRNPLALVASSSSQAKPDWHPNSDATHHLTNDIANLNLWSEDYDHSDQIHVGNGASLQISKIGSSSLSTYAKPFILNQVLIFPSIQKNLVSVQ